MVAFTTQVHEGWTVGPGWQMGSAGGGSGPSGSNGVVGFSEMTAGGNQQQWLEDQTATMITNGFILNAASGNGQNLNGVAINYLTANNQSFFSTYGSGNRTATWANGSSMTVNLSQNDQSGQPGVIVFFMNDVVSFPATFIFPVTFS